METLSKKFYPCTFDPKEFFLSKFPQSPTFPAFAIPFLERHGAKKFLIDAENGKVYTYQEVLQDSRRIAGALRLFGLKPGEVVCLCSCSCPQYFSFFLAISIAGGIITHANPLATIKELVYQLKETESIFIIVDSERKKVAEDAALKAPFVRKIFEFNDFMYVTNENAGFDNLIAINPRTTPLHIPFSSGTTGLPKGVLLSHLNTLTTIAELSQSRFAVTDENDIMLIVLPLYHLYALLMLMLSMVKGSTVVLLPRFRPTTFLSAIQDYECTVIPVVPSLALFLVQSHLVEKYDLSSFRKCFSAAAPLPPVVAQKLLQQFHLKSLRQGYGMTEIGFATFGPNDCLQPTSIGVSLPSVEIKVVDGNSGAALGPFSIGEICVRGPQVMIGYLNNSQATTELIDTESWVHTGDLGYYDNKGHFFYVERAKEIFKYKGHQVAPAEIEALLLTHPAVSDVAVIGVPDENAGEVPRAYVVVRENTAIAEADLIHFVFANCSQEKHLRGGIHFVAVIPRSCTGKILRKDLRQSYLENTLKLFQRKESDQNQ